MQNRILISLLAAFTQVWATTLSAQQQSFEPVSAVLKYAETELVETAPAQTTSCGGGGLLGAMDCVAERIENAGTESGGGSGPQFTEIEKGSVSSTYQLTPVLLPVPNSDLFQVRFRVAGGNLTTAGEIGPEVRADAENDNRLIRERLRRFRVDLYDDQVEKLRAGDTLDVPVEAPFFQLQRLEIQHPVVASVYLPSSDIVRSVDFMGRDGGAGSLGLTQSDIALSVIDTFTPFRLYVTYDEAPQSPPLSISAQWSGGSKRVALQRTGDPKAFSSKWLVIDAGSMRSTRERSNMRGSDEAMSASAAELFSGEWTVSHSGGEIGNAEGIARVSQQGDNIRLFLDAGGKASRYESIEILATRDSVSSHHTLDVRFLRKGDDEGWGPPRSSKVPQGQVLYLPEGTLKMSAELRGTRQQVDVELAEEGPDHFRVSLMNRTESGIRMSGEFNRERADGSLQGEGQQTWGLAPKILGVVVLEEQRPKRPELGDFSKFMADDSPRQGEYIFKAGPNDANRSTDYPFRKDAQNDTSYRTLFVYGHNLPQRGSDALNLGSADELVSYELRAFPGEGHDQLFELGHKKLAARETGPSVETISVSQTLSASKTESDSKTESASKTGNVDGEATELILTANFKKGVLTGIKGLTINRARGLWHLDFADANVFPSFTHRWREDFETEIGEFTPTEIAYLNNNVYLTLDEQTPLPHESLDLNLSVNGKPALELKVQRQSVEGEPSYKSVPIRLLRRELYEQEEAPTEIDGAQVVLANVGDRLEAELSNPYLVRAIPVRVAAEVVSGPDKGTLWKDALKRVAACFNETNIDIDGYTNDESDTYSKFIFTENMLQLASPMLFGLAQSRSISISKGDHAAAILIRDQFLANLKNTIPELLGILTDDEKLWQFYQTRNASSMPFWKLIKVQGPGEDMESEVGAFLTELGVQVSEAVVNQWVLDLARSGADMVRGDATRNEGTWPIGDLVDDITTSPETFGNSQRHAHLYALRKVKEALRRMIDSASNAYARATNAGDCDVEELMLIGGQDSPGLVDSILPRLVRPNENGGGEAWEPDFTAQGYVKSLKVKGASIRALDAYARIDEAYQAMALAVATAGAAAALTASGAAVAGSYMMLAGDVADMMIYGSQEFDRYLESQPLIDYAVGATAGGMSETFHEQALQTQTSGLEAAAALFGAGLGAGLGAFDISDATAASRGARLMDELGTIDKAAIEGLSAQKQRDLFSYFADLESRKPGGRLKQLNNLGRTHDGTEAADYSKFAQYLGDNGVDVAGSGLRVADELAENTGGARSALDDLFEEPVTTARVDPLENAPPTVKVVDDPASDSTRLTRADSPDVPIERTRGEGDITNPADDMLPARNIDDPDAHAETVRVSDETLRVDSPTTRMEPEPAIADTRRIDDPDAHAETVRASDETLRVDSPTTRMEPEPAVVDARRIDDPDAHAETVRAGDETLRVDSPTTRMEPEPAVADARRIDDPDAHAETVRAGDETLRVDSPTARVESEPAVADARRMDDPPAPRKPAPEEPDDPTPVYPAAEESPPSTAWTKELSGAGPVRVVDENGQEHILQFGKMKGKPGASSVAYSDGADSGAVMRVEKLDSSADRIKDRINDSHGRENMERIIKENPDADYVRVATLKRKITIKDSDIPELNGKTIEFVEVVPSTAADRIAKNGGHPTTGQLLAMDASKRLFNRNGYFWTDGHARNFDLVPVEGQEDVWQMVIFDTGHMYPVRGETPYERWKNARAIQEEFANPPQAFITKLDNAQTPQQLKKIKNDRLVEIYLKHEDIIASDARPKGANMFGGSPSLSANLSGYSIVAGRDAGHADRVFTSWTGSAPVPAPKPTAADLAREQEAASLAGSAAKPDATASMDIERTGNTAFDDATGDIDIERTGNLAIDDATTDIDTINPANIEDFRNAETELIEPANWSRAEGQWVTPQGSKLSEGEIFGQGKYADVARLVDESGNPTGNVVKSLDTHTGEGGHLFNQQGARVRATEEGARLLDEAGILQAEIRHADPNGRRIVQREINANLPSNVKSEALAEDLISDNAGTLNKAQSEAVASMFKKFNDGKLRVEDPNDGNIFIREPLNPEEPLEAGILDQDRIIGEEDFVFLDHMEENVPAESTGILKKSVADEHGLVIDPDKWKEIDFYGTPAFESKTNLGQFKKLAADKDNSIFNNLFKPEGKGLAEFWSKAEGETYLNSAKKFNYYTLIEKGWLKYEPGVGLTSGRMDLETAVEYFPDLPDTLNIRAGDEWKNVKPSGEVDTTQLNLSPSYVDLPIAA